MKKGNNLPSDQAEAPLVLSAFCFTDAHAWVSQSASLSFIISRATRGAAGCTICSRSMEVPLLEFHRQLSKYRRPTNLLIWCLFHFPCSFIFIIQNVSILPRGSLCLGMLQRLHGVGEAIMCGARMGHFVGTAR